MDMATSAKSLDYTVEYPEIQQSFRIQLGMLIPKKTTVLLLVLGVLTFTGALYYVEQQVRLRTLNYEIIRLKEQQNALLKQQKTLQLQLDQMKRLEQIETRMTLQGFVPVAEEQVRLVP